MTTVDFYRSSTLKTVDAAITARSLEKFFESERVFLCNSNRGAPAPSYDYLEREMRGRGFAAAWINFNYPQHMQRVAKDHLIFMFAKRIGVVGVGVVTDHPLEILGRDHPDRIRAFRFGQHEQEWRIRVNWLAWDESNPCYSTSSLRPSFQEITSHTERVRVLKAHFLRRHG